MRKTDKKRDKEIIQALTDVCESALKEINEFSWLTHTVNYDRFPKSLMIYCIFETKTGLKAFVKTEAKAYLLTLINTHLKRLNIALSPIESHVIFDSEEACSAEHRGNWAKRLAQH